MVDVWNQENSGVNGKGIWVSSSYLVYSLLMTGFEILIGIFFSLFHFHFYLPDSFEVQRGD